MAIFTIEYLARLWTADLKVKANNRVVAALKYIIMPMALIDLFAILPFYLPILIPFDLRFLRALRLMRLFKIQRYSRALTLISKVLKDKKEELSVTLLVQQFSF